MILGFGFLILRNKELSTAGQPMKFLSREFVLFAGSFLLLLIAAGVTAHVARMPMPRAERDAAPERAVP